MIFLDLDDTLLMDDLTVSDVNKNSIKKAMERGIKVVLCTGRIIFGVERYIEELSLFNDNGYVICQNGGTIYNAKTKELLMEKTFDSKLYAPVVKIARKFNISIQGFRDKSMYAETITERIIEYSSKMNVPITHVEDLTVSKEPFSKLLLNGEHEELVKAKLQIDLEINGSINCFFSKPHFLEFSELTATKGTTMLELASMLGVDKDEVIAMGDSYNDIHMIQMAGLGVAVANAEEEVKSYADYITINTNETHAVSEVIEKFMIIDW